MEFFVIISTYINILFPTSVAKSIRGIQICMYNDTEKNENFEIIFFIFIKKENDQPGGWVRNSFSSNFFVADDLHKIGQLLCIKANGF